LEWAHRASCEPAMRRTHLRAAEKVSLLPLGGLFWLSPLASWSGSGHLRFIPHDGGPLRKPRHLSQRPPFWRASRQFNFRQSRPTPRIPCRLTAGVKVLSEHPTFSRPVPTTSNPNTYGVFLYQTCTFSVQFRRKTARNRGCDGEPVFARANPQAGRHSRVKPRAQISPGISSPRGQRDSPRPSPTHRVAD
jgi:hypothetical protein